MDKKNSKETKQETSNQSYKESEAIVQPKTGWQTINLNELIEYKDLFYFLVWRDIKVLYAQTILGFFWALILPLIQIIIFTIIFGKIARIETEGIPYFLFTTVAIIPWTFMSQSVDKSSLSLVYNQKLLGKVYFPRLFFPLTAIFAKLVDFFISFIILIAVSLYYKVIPTWQLLYLPVFIIMMVVFSSGIGILLSSMAIRFRDVKHAMSFGVRMLMYSAPIVYSASTIPEKWRILYSINPIVGIVEGFRACLLGSQIPWEFIFPGAIANCFIFIIGIFYFKRMEKIFVDVI